ncbi:RNA-directed DNA polymerase from mobile element jockey [Eumeta japonica]|uniref:RNA-directed DNA polymerase from mobile element jockey n=1 Tax=Eumeta variegata TaxID=151549 RepID=A0A4C1ZD07_EUMVA|nr:RNA-directed DNA polymerase from mobile element jockey [Eumeta japonica]
MRASERHASLPLGHVTDDARAPILLIPPPRHLRSVCKYASSESRRVRSSARDQRLDAFLAMANKYLELVYFPRAWKVAVIKVIPKPGRDDYTRPKSYRPIGLLPVLGKIVERMLVGRLA